MTETDVLVLGAGAAGLMCAIYAGRRGRRVLVLEHADRPGKKILISGGGRCNFTNLYAGPENYLSQNPHFARSALAAYKPQHFLELVQSHNIPWHEKTLGQLFCDRSAHDILNLLLAECKAANVAVQLSTSILSVERDESETRTAFIAATSRDRIRAESVVVATGGLSIPKMGATSLGYEIARAFNHPIVEPRPALVPLVLSPEDQERWCDLSGLSAEVNARLAAAGAAAPRRGGPPVPAFREKILITHRGLSGPAVLQISSYWRPGDTLELDLAPGLQVFTALSAASGPGRDATAAAGVLRGVLPARLASRWLEIHAPGTQINPRAPLSNAAIAALERDLHAWRVTPAGTEGYAKAEVTAGGISTAALDGRTMESRLTPGLYFIGEVVDVTGWLGGYNFQWAWSSGVAAGLSA